MPAVLAPALIGLVTTLGAGAAVATAVGTIGAYAITIGASIGASYALNRLMAKKKAKGDPQITQFTTKQPMPSRVRAYGRCKLGGALFFEEAVPVQNAALTLGVVHCEGPVDGIEAWYLNDTNAGIAEGLGGINHALPWAFYVALESRRGGSDNSSLNSLLSSYGFTGHLYGLCYTAMQCRQPIQPAKNFQYYYPQGIPSVRIVARCSRVFDPRDNTQAWTDPSTWKFSRNPALIVMDYLTFGVTDADGRLVPRGMGLPTNKINAASFAAFADMCDAPFATIYAFDVSGNVISSAGTEPRYSCDGAYDLSEAPSDILTRLLATCDGTLYTLADGSVGIRGGQWAAPSVTIDDTMILSADLSQGNDKLTSFNQLKISITATNMDYQVVEGTPYDDADNQDINGILPQDLSLPYVQSYSQARRLAKIEMAKGNPRWRYNSLICTLAALDALGQEFVHVTHSLAGIDEDFLVVDCKLHNEGGIPQYVELQLVSLSSAAYSWNAALEALPPPSTNGVEPVTPDLRSPLVHILADGATVDLGVVSDGSFSSDDWGAASDATHGDADLGLMSA